MSSEKIDGVENRVDGNLGRSEEENVVEEVKVESELENGENEMKVEES